MKKYISYVVIFFTILIIAVMIDKNNSPIPKSASTEISFGDEIISGVAGAMISNLFSGEKTAEMRQPASVAPSWEESGTSEEPSAIVPADFSAATAFNDTPAQQIVDIPFEPTQSSPDPDNLIQNGYFLESYESWKRELTDEGGSSKASIIDSNNSPFNRALQINQTGLGNIYFTQTVPINSIHLNFTLTFETVATKGLIWGFSGTGYAAIVIDYIDLWGESLGYTALNTLNENPFAGRPAVGAPEKIKDTNTSHFIKIEPGQVNKNFTINLAEEVNENLLGINPDEIRSIGITLIAGSNDQDAEATLTVSDIVLKYYY